MIPVATRRLLRLGMVVAGVLAGALVAALLGLDHAVHTPLDVQAAQLVEVRVDKGVSGRALGQLMCDHGIIRSPLLWRYHLWRRGGLQAKAGRHLLSPSMALPALATALEDPPLPEDVPFIMIEGWRLADTDQALAQAGWSQPGQYLQAARQPSAFKAPFALPTTGTLEGYLYPETYGVVPWSFSVNGFLQRQLDTFVQRVFTPHREEIARSGRSIHELVTMASLLEREEPSPSQRPLVAGILWKRLDARTPLGVDATSRYELVDWNDRREFLKKLRNVDDKWNTRHKPGLPPGPIGAPTLASFLAALRPQASEFWYYLHDAQRVLHPSRNAAEHEALRARHNVY